MVRFLGALLIAAGGLIATLSGLCTLVFLGATLKGGGTPNAALGMLALVGVVGGVPFMLGVGMIVAGVVLLRSGRKPKPDTSAFS